MPQRDDLFSLRQAKLECSKRFLASDVQQVRALAVRRAIVADPASNVQGIGIGAKIVSNRLTATMAVKIFVRMKHARTDLSPSELLPSSFDGIPTDIEEIGQILPLVTPRSWMRPVRPGCSIGFGSPDDATAIAGTFGALVADDLGSYILSNNHVLADENRLPLGTPISEPSPLDGGDPARDRIGLMCGYVPLIPDGDNYVDCAIAQLDDDRLAVADTLAAGSPTGVVEARLHAPVAKSGRTTGLTRGQIVSVDTDIRVPYDIGTLLFREQIAIRSLDAYGFSAAGDSGSMVIDEETGAAVGLLFSGGTAMSFANHMSDVLTALGVELVTG